jgi:hypothetical protein
VSVTIFLAIDNFYVREVDFSTLWVEKRLKFFSGNAPVTVTFFENPAGL